MEQKDFEHIKEYMDFQGFDYPDYHPFILFLVSKMDSEDFTLKLIEESVTKVHNSYRTEEGKKFLKESFIEFIEGL